MQPKIEPSSEVKQAYTRARRLFQAGELNAAKDAVKAVIELSPQFASGRRLCADILTALGQFAAARAQLNHALRLFPDSASQRRPIHLHLATTFIKEGDLAGALLVLRSSDLKPVGDLEIAILPQLGYLLTLCEAHEEALEVFEAALLTRPSDPLFLFNCAAANRAMGNLKRAEKLYDRTLILNPEDWEAYKNRSDLRKQSPDNNHVALLCRILTRKDLPEVAKIQLNFSLAKEYEDLGDYLLSFESLQRGSKARRKTIDYRLNNDLSVMSDIEGKFHGKFLSHNAVPRSQGEEIIFVLGMPRTGSTLLDRVLCASGEVISAGEPDTFARLLLRQAGIDGDVSRGNNEIGRAHV